MPSSLTEYLVLEGHPATDATGPDAPIRFEALGVVEARDHRAAIDVALDAVSRPEADRHGHFAAAPTRNWKQYEIEAEARYHSTTRETRVGSAA